MAVHYEVEEGKTLVIDGPANVVVKTGKVPMIGTGVKAADVSVEGEDAPATKKKSK